MTVLGTDKNAYRVLVGKSEGKRQLRRCKRKWEFILKKEDRKASTAFI
jgi:hypothetical protein